jgi:hypothetical protein
MTDLLLDTSFTRRLPTPLALAATALAEETTTHGVHTTADELAACIEAFFGLVGRVWVAEYLAAGAPDPAANALLHGRLVVAYRDPLLGAWIGIAHTLRKVFLERGLEPVARGLNDLDVGALGDTSHPVARLSAYRNSFAHGSFHAVVDDIVKHRALLEDLLARLPFLTEQPILVDDGAAVLALRGDAEVATRPAAQLVPHHPTLVGDDGRSVDLHPLAVGKGADGAPGLVWTSVAKAKKGTAPSPRDLAQHERFAIWAERYQRELEGDVEAATTCLGEPMASGPVPAELERAVAEVEASGRCLVLVESPPGAPRRALLAHAARAGGLSWRVEPGGLMGSGLVLVKAIARQAERQLKLERGVIALRDVAAWRATIAEIATRCGAGGQRLLIVLDDLHLGDAPTRPGEPSVHEVWRQLASGPWTVVGGAVRSWSLRPLPWDARVAMGWGLGVDPDEVARFLATRASRPLHRRVLEALLAVDGAVDLFSLCDALEATNVGDAAAQPAFEPAVERALWDLAPILALARARRTHDGVEEDARTFAPLDRALLQRVTSEAR